MNLDSKHIPLERAFLCPCGLVGENAMQCACGNPLGLLSLARALNRQPPQLNGLMRYCTKCGQLIADQSRIRHRSPYCSDACRRDARNDLRAALCRDRCRLCGRSSRQKTKPAEDFSCIFHNAQGNLPLEADQPSNEGAEYEAK